MEYSSERICDLRLKKDEEEAVATGGRSSRRTRANQKAVARQLEILEDGSDHESGDTAECAESGGWSRKRRRAATRGRRGGTDGAMSQDSIVVRLEENLEAERVFQRQLQQGAERDAATILLLRQTVKKLKQEGVLLRAACAAKHTLLLEAWRERRDAEGVAAHHRARARNASSGWTKHEGQVSGLRHTSNETKRELAVKQVECNGYNRRFESMAMQKVN